MTNIVVCFYKPADAELIKNALSRAGYRVAYSCCSGAKALETCNKLGSGIIISGYRLLDMICLDLFDSKPESFQMITVSAAKNWEFSIPPKEMKMTGIPLNINVLTELIDEADRLIRKEKINKRSLRHLRTEEENRIIEMAKEKCISEMNMTEPEAHRYLQNMAMKNQLSLPEYAKGLLKKTAV